MTTLTADYLFPAAVELRAMGRERAIAVMVEAAATAGAAGRADDDKNGRSPATDRAELEAWLASYAHDEAALDALGADVREQAFAAAWAAYRREAGE